MLDIFALGVTMFSTFFYTSPLKEGRASRSDELFKYIYKKQYDKFWSRCNQIQHFAALISQDIGPEAFQSLKELFQCVIAYEPQVRPTAQELNNVLKELCAAVKQ